MQRLLLKVAILGAAIVPIFSVSPAQAQATRTWVSGVGDDANPCSRTAPCKTFAGAISKTAANGKINCLDPGGFGAVTITKSIEIDCLQFPGGILSAGTNGVIVASTAGIKVILRGIEIHGGGSGLNGVHILIPADVTIDKCFITAITGNGVNVATTAAGVGTVTVLDTVLTQMNNGIAMSATGGGTAIGNIRGTTIARVTASGVTLTSSNTRATVSNSLLTGNTTGGNSGASDSQLNVVGSVVTFNTTGLNAAASGAIIRMSDNNIVNNGTSIAVAGGATLSSGGNNRVEPAGPAPTATWTTQ